MPRTAAVLIDLSGTIHVEDLAIPLAVEALKKLRGSGRTIRFVTNTTKEPIRVLHTRLLNCGFEVDKSEIFTSLLAARRFVEDRHFRPMLLLEPESKEDFEGVSTTNPNAVVVGLAPSEFEYNRLNDAFRLLLEGAELVAIHKAKYFKQKDGLSLGPGPFVTGLEYATGKKAFVVGKPSVDFFKLALADLPEHVDLKNTVMIGDELRITESRRNCVASFAQAVDLILSEKVI